MIRSLLALFLVVLAFGFAPISVRPASATCPAQFLPSTIAPDADCIFRDWNTDGVPSSGPFNPRKADFRAWGEAVARGLQNQGRMNVLDYLPSNEPTNAGNDNTSGFVAAANAGCASPYKGARITVPKPPNFGGVTATYYRAGDIINNCGNYWEGETLGGFGGTQTSAGAEFSTNGGIIIAYDQAQYFAIAWLPSGYPATTPGQLLLGGGVSNIAFQTQPTDVTKTALKIFGAYYFGMHDVRINSAYNGIEFFGGGFSAARDVAMVHTRNVNWYFHGDLTGKTTGGSACTAANPDCSTRYDFFVGQNLTNIDNGGTNIAFLIKNMVNTIMTDHTGAEGPAHGLVVSCDAYNAVSPNFDQNLNDCPHFIFMTDFQTEFCSSTCAVITDAIKVTLHSAYLYGTLTSPSTLIMGTTNYGSSTIPAGRAIVDGDSLVFVAANDCIYTSGVWYDFMFVNNEVNGCNSSNAGRGVMNISSTTPHLKVHDNQLGTADGYTGTHTPAYGVSIGANVSWADIHDNNFDGLDPSVSPIISTSTFPGTNHVHDNEGPWSVAPTIGGDCGAGAHFNNIAKWDEFIITVGSGSPTTCTITFQPQYTSPTFTFSPVSGANTGSLSLTGSVSTVVLHGSGLSGSYELIGRLP